MKYLGKDQQIMTSLAEVSADSSISVIDADQTGTLDSKKIVVGRALENRHIIDLVNDKGARHVVQMPNMDFARQVSFSAHIMTCSEQFFENPRKHLVEMGPQSLIDKPRGVMHYPLTIYGQKQSILDAFRMDLANVPKASKIADQATLVADEMLMNMIKDAPLYFAKNFPGMSATGRSSSLTVAYDDQRLLLWTEDDYGSLSVDKMLARLKECYSEKPLNPNMDENEGAGLGCRIIFDISVSMSVFVKSGKKTVFCVVLPLGMSNRQRENMPKNISIISLNF